MTTTTTKKTKAAPPKEVTLFRHDLSPSYRILVPDEFATELGDRYLEFLPAGGRAGYAHVDNEALADYVRDLIERGQVPGVYEDLRALQLACPFGCGFKTDGNWPEEQQRLAKHVREEHASAKED